MKILKTFRKQHSYRGYEHLKHLKGYTLCNKRRNVNAKHEYEYSK